MYPDQREGGGGIRNKRKKKGKYKSLNQLI